MVSDSVCLGWGLRIRISNKLSSSNNDADVAGPMGNNLNTSSFAMWVPIFPKYILETDNPGDHQAYISTYLLDIFT